MGKFLAGIYTFFLICLLLAGGNVKADTLFDQSTDTPDDDFAATNSNWLGQEFVASASYNLTSVTLKFDSGTCVTDGTVSIRAVSGGVPTGGDLSSGTFSCVGLGSFPTGSDRSISMTAAIPITNGNPYAILVRTNAATNIGWQAKDSGTFTGQSFKSTDSGASWTNVPGYSNAKFVFATYGYAGTPTPTPTPTATPAPNSLTTASALVSDIFNKFGDMFGSMLPLFYAFIGVCFAVLALTLMGRAALGFFRRF